MTYDALLLLSFGGPDGPDDVRPFLANVTRGRNIPAARLDIAAGHYERFGGISPINAANRALLDAVAARIDIPVYSGNRNWHPLIEDTVRTMVEDGIRRVVCFVTSAYGGYSACRQYLDDIDRACAAVGDAAPVVDKLRPYFDHPGFVEPMAGNVTAALHTLDPDLRRGAHLVFTAHSVPLTQPGVNAYVAQVNEASRLVAERTAGSPPWSVSWQSRSGAPGQPWLEPDVGDHLATIAATGATAAVVVPIGFVSDHMEVVFDLDVEAAARASAVGMPYTRAATVGTAPAFVAMIGELIAERTDPDAAVRALGRRIDCPGDCCTD